MTHALAPARLHLPRTLRDGFTRFAGGITHGTLRIADMVAPSIVDAAHTTAAQIITEVRESYQRTSPQARVRLGNARVAVPFFVRRRPELLENYLIELRRFLEMNYRPIDPDRISLTESHGTAFVYIIVDDVDAPDSHLHGAESDPDIRSLFYSPQVAA